MGERKTISKKIRFEVFKRDSFTCQYCGKSAPDVILEIDHIKPVSKGGTNDILNLVTSCKECNSGKSNTELDDDSVVAKQKRQLDEMNERYEQLKMMVEWRDNLRNIKNMEFESVCSEWESSTDYTLTDLGKTNIRKLVKKYSMNIIFEAIDIACTSYLEYDNDAKCWSLYSIEKAFNKLPGICRNIVNPPAPEMKTAWYCRAILRKRLRYINENNVIPVIREAISRGVTEDELKEVCKTCKNWSHFLQLIEDAETDADIRSM